MTTGMIITGMIITATITMDMITGMITDTSMVRAVAMIIRMSQSSCVSRSRAAAAMR